MIDEKAYGKVFGRIMQKYPTAGIHLVNDILREAWEAVEPAPLDALRDAANVLCDWIDALERRAHGEFGVWHEETMVAEQRDVVRRLAAGDKVSDR